MPQQLVDGINITADTHPTFPLGAEVAVDESVGLSVGHWVAINCSILLPALDRESALSFPAIPQ